MSEACCPCRGRKVEGHAQHSRDVEHVHPNGSARRKGQPESPAYNIDKRATMPMDKECRVVNDPCSAERSLWERLELSSDSTVLTVHIAAVLLLVPELRPMQQLVERVAAWTPWDSAASPTAIRRSKHFPRGQASSISRPTGSGLSVSPWARWSPRGLTAAGCGGEAATPARSCRTCLPSSSPGTRRHYSRSRLWPYSPRRRPDFGMSQGTASAHWILLLPRHSGLRQTRDEVARHRSDHGVRIAIANGAAIGVSPVVGHPAAQENLQTTSRV